MTFKVTLQPSGHAFEVPPGVTVLNAGLEANWNLPYSCRAGTCRTCRGRVVEGRVDHGESHPAYLDEAARAKGYALLCQAKPLSDLVVEVEELLLQAVKPRLMPCRVKRIEKPAPDVAILGLRLPMNENLMFAAGQFVDFQLPGGKTRSYSIATPPAAEGVIDIELHVRHTPGGLFTDRVFSTLKEGEVLRVRGPLGTFYLREESDRPILFLASGTGLAPVRSMIGYAQRRGLQRPMKLYWGCRTRRDFYMPPPAGIECVQVLSDEAWDGRTGFVHHALMEDFPDLSGHQVYACGAPRMVDAARRDFVAQCRLPEEHFFADSFLTEADLK